jgi:hypothetical protein
VRLAAAVCGAAVLLASCGGVLAADLDDTSDAVTDWAVDRLAAFGIDEDGVLAATGDLPRVVWTNPATGAVLIGYSAPPCRQYPAVDVRGRDGTLAVTIDPVVDPTEICDTTEVGWGLALFLEAPWTADDVVPAMAR